MLTVILIFTLTIFNTMNTYLLPHIMEHKKST